jgi:hypothetical protein
METIKAYFLVSGVRETRLFKERHGEPMRTQPAAGPSLFRMPKCN